MKQQEMDKHIKFLHEYGIKNNIIFRVSRKGVTVEEL